MRASKSGLITAAVVAATFVTAAIRVHTRADRPGLPPPTAAPVRAASTAAPPPASRAFSDLFGVQAAEASVVTGPGEQTLLWHQQAFTLAGSPAQALFTETRFAAAAEPPSISAAAYRLADGQWKLAGASKDFTRTGPWGKLARPAGPLQVLQFPSGAVAFLVDEAGGARGYTQAGKGIWAFANGEWRDLGFVQTGGDNSGASGAHYRFTGEISMAPGTRTWPDMLVTRRGTIRDEADRVVPATDTRYVFTGKGYEEVMARR